MAKTTSNVLIQLWILEISLSFDNAVVNASCNTNVGVAAQNLHWEQQGAFTDESSAEKGEPCVAGAVDKAEERADELAQAIIDKALDGKSLGDVPALKEVFDRGIGKVVQGLDHTTLGKEMPQPILSMIQDADNKTGQ